MAGRFGARGVFGVPRERLPTAVNAKLRAQAAAPCPRVADLRKVLARVDRQIADYTRVIARGDFASLEIAL